MERPVRPSQQQSQARNDSPHHGVLPPFRDLVQRGTVAVSPSRPNAQQETVALGGSSSGDTTPGSVVDSWRPPNGNLERFDAFLGNHSDTYAPLFVDQLPQALAKTPAYGATGSSLESASLSRDHVPTVVSPKTAAEHPDHLDAADIAFLKAKGAFDLPPTNLQRELVESYFKYINPASPVVNQTRFRADFDRGVVSRLLLFAVFTAGSKACQSPLLIDVRGTRLKSGQQYFKITKALLDTSYETDKLTQVQALLLMSWWWDKHDDGRNMRTYAIKAISVAQSLGMGRWIQYPTSDPVLCGLWKKVWWCCVIRDATTSTASRLPLFLRDSDWDVPLLSADDFVEDDGLSCSESEIQFFIQLAKLSEMLGMVLMKNYRRILAQDRDFAMELDRLQREWFDNVPEELQYDVDDTQRHRYWPAYLNIYFFTMICIDGLERSGLKTQTQGKEQASDQYWSQARGLAAASMVIKTIRNLKAHGQIGQCHGFMINSLLYCLIYCKIEAESPRSEVRAYARQKYSICLNALYDFGQLWVSASYLHTVFEALQPAMNGSNQKPGPNSLFDQGDMQPWPSEVKSSAEIGNSVMRIILAAERPSGPLQLHDKDHDGVSPPDRQLTDTNLHPVSLDTLLQNDLSSFSPDLFGYNGNFSVDTMDTENWYGFLNMGGGTL
ncbi:hypothetical protein PV08_08208 [Exophiala spinifera]|uniref:Xylanolytic transcriptional activator regulatory domain-containing protein n=1 Tax=Exophiala spinifera TaxID=91928 RepID=A0A0D1YDI1_9EURO|nr:uncharacterized protein PV08_08208 [Exophiala spinifera]KIW13021.1 hypothetical protein PV08_08208 [Exophiala spinifera]